MKAVYIITGAVVLILLVVAMIDTDTYKRLYVGDLVVENTKTDNFLLIEAVEDDLRFPVDAVRLATTEKDAEVRSVLNGVVLGFKAGEEREAYLSVQLPHSRKDNSILEPHFHWIAEDNTAGVVTWCIEYRCANVGGNFTGSNTKCINSTAQGNNTHVISQEIQINNTLTTSAMCLIRIYRAGDTDTYNNYANLLEFDIHYYKDKLGKNI